MLALLKHNLTTIEAASQKIVVMSLFFDTLVCQKEC